eukprot:6181392-Pleurochrysis_carterae.AAC.2
MAFMYMCTCSKDGSHVATCMSEWHVRDGTHHVAEKGSGQVCGRAQGKLHKFSESVDKNVAEAGAKEIFTARIAAWAGTRIGTRRRRGSYHARGNSHQLPARQAGSLERLHAQNQLRTRANLSSKLCKLGLNVQSGICVHTCAESICEVGIAPKASCGKIAAVDEASSSASCTRVRCRVSAAAGRNDSEAGSIEGVASTIIEIDCERTALAATACRNVWPACSCRPLTTATPGRATQKIARPMIMHTNQRVEAVDKIGAPAYKTEHGQT